MNKFAKPTEEDYQTVREVIERMVAKAPQMVLARSQCDSTPPYHAALESNLNVLQLKEYTDRWQLFMTGYLYIFKIIRNTTLYQPNY